jgi:hypothetical protein
MKYPLLSRTATAVAALSMLTGTIGWLVARGDEPSDAREVKTRLRHQARSIESLEVRYKLRTTSPLEPKRLVAMAQFHNQMFLPIEERHEAFKGPKRFHRVLRPERVENLQPTDEFGLMKPGPVNPKAPAAIRENQRRMIEQYERAIANMKAVQARGMLPPKRDSSVRPLSDRDTTRAFNGRTLWMRQPLTAEMDTFQVWSPKSEANWFQATPYAVAIGLHVTDPTGNSMAMKAQAMFRLADWVNDHGYTLEEKTEVVDGATCVILRGSLNSLLQPSLFAGDLSDRTWLDRDHGLAIRRREFAKDGRPSVRWVNDELREMTPGLWLPMHCRQETYAEDAPPEWKDKPVMIQEIRVSKVEVNHASDDLFDMVPKKSDRIEDLRGGFSSR